MRKNKKYVFELFVPPNSEPRPINLEKLYKITNKKYSYAARGRYAIYHALKALNVSGKVIIPAYACGSIMHAIQKAGLECVFCDINENDLNIEFNSFRNVQEKSGAKCVIVPSLYGNPADLDKITKYSNGIGVQVIDDAAQSFGASIEGKLLSTFGNAGLFSFSPGKATPGHMGALFWTENKQYQIDYKQHYLIHKIIYYNYKINRIEAYKNISSSVRKITSKLANIAERMVTIDNDRMCPFEDKLLGSVMWSCLDGDFLYRNKYLEKFSKEVEKIDSIRVIKCQRGKPMNHKIVFITKSIEIADDLKKYLKSMKIAYFGGYKILNDSQELATAKSTVNRVIELPIENNDEKMQYLFDTIKKYF